MILHYAGQYQAVCDIFYDAIYQTASSAYTPEQLAAWAPLPWAYSAWQWRCELFRPFLFVREGGVLGFLELTPSGHIDCLYTSPAFNRQGVASSLLVHAINVSANNGLTRLETEDSELARALFARHGFVTLGPNTVTRRGVVLTNWCMERSLKDPSENT